MTQIDRIIGRFLCVVSDFRFSELVRFLNNYGFKQIKSGKTSGSRCKFFNSDTGDIIGTHKPHPNSKSVTRGELRRIQKYLIRQGYLLPNKK